MSFILFPGVTNDASFGFLSNSNIHNAESWYQLLSVFVFNIADTIGRFCGNYEALELKLTTTKKLVYARILFMATFLLTDFAAPPVWIWSADWFKVTNLVLFAFSNGYLTTLCALKVPGTVEVSRRPLVSIYIVVCICAGILIGSVLQIGMTPILAMTPKHKVVTSL